MKIYAHRGYSYYYPENTMIAFEKAIEYGCDGIELDVQFSRDKQLIVIHDEKLNRTSGVNSYAKNCTYKELLEYDFSLSKPSLEAGVQRIPLLSEVLNLCKNTNTTLNIELKNSVIEYFGLEEAVLKEVSDYGDYKNVIYSSFNHESVKRLIALDNTIQVAPLIDRKLPDLVKYIKSLGARGVHPSGYAIDEEILKKLIENDMFVNVYTINDLEIARKLKEYKVTSIFTDLCKEMKEGL